jgi:putative ABC transport system permease protein
VKDQMSYDNLHTESSNVYRLLRVGSINDEPYKMGVTSAPFSEALITDYPQEIENTTKVLIASGLVSSGDKHFIEDKLFLTDSSFFDFFSFPLEFGDTETALDLPNSILLTKETAIKYFGNEDPINKIITVDNQLEFIVTGVFAKTTHKSHLDFDFVGNVTPLLQLGFMADWWSNGFYTYIKIAEGYSSEELESHFPAFMDKYFGNDFERMGSRIEITLQPFDEIFFDNEVTYDQVLHGNMETVYLFMVIGIFIFIIACINYTNLATTKSEQRAKEVGVRKTLGSSKKQLTFQFFMESLLIVSIAVMLSFMIIEILLPIFNEVFALELYPERSIVVLTAMAVSITIITGLLSGLYPSIVLSSLRPIEVLKGHRSLKHGKISLRKILVIVQFSISMFMIIFTLIVYKQMSHINNSDLGFDKDQIVLLELNYNTINQQIESFSNILSAYDGINSLSLSSSYPGGYHDTNAVKVEGVEEQPKFRTLFTDESFVSTYGLEIASGRNFSKEYSTDVDNALLLNERAVKELGWTNEEAVGKRMYLTFIDSTYREVVGVVKDYHFSSLKTDVEPLIIDMSDRTSLMSIKIKSGSDVRETLSFIESEWSKSVPFKPEFTFLNESIDNLYQAERLQSRLFIFFASVSIFIASMGIFGLASYTVVQRKKEIGIRKVLGATILGISKLLTGDYVKLILIANLIAWPLSYYAANLWLIDFASRTTIGVEVFVVALFAGLFIALGSVVFQSMRAATANPVDSLKDE